MSNSKVVEGNRPTVPEIVVHFRTCYKHALTNCTACRL